MKNNVPLVPTGNRFQYRDYWVEIYTDDQKWFEPNIECPNKSGVVWLEGEYNFQNVANKAKHWIDEQY